MAKLRTGTIAEGDLIEFVDTSSDFAFELRCLERLTALGFECQHGGSYTDPLTKKTRQFDIRAQKFETVLRVRCAVECKSLTNSFPLLTMTVPRGRDESFHDLVLSYHPDSVEQANPRIPAYDKRCEAIRVQPSQEYAAGAPVAKSCAQVGRANDGAITANDAEVFEKWSQALASADDLIEAAAAEGEEKSRALLTLVLPILVVPDGTLWTVAFEANGKRAADPVQTDRCSFIVGKNYSMGQFQPDVFCASHLDFVTLSGLEQLMSGALLPKNGWFPEEILRRLGRRFA